MAAPPRKRPSASSASAARGRSAPIALFTCALPPPPGPWSPATRVPEPACPGRGGVAPLGAGPDPPRLNADREPTLRPVVRALSGRPHDRAAGGGGWPGLLECRRARASRPCAAVRRTGELNAYASAAFDALRQARDTGGASEGRPCLG